MAWLCITDYSFKNSQMCIVTGPNIDIGTLDRIKRDISDSYSKGKIDNEHYSNLKNEISMLYQEVFKKQIDLLKSKIDNEDKTKLSNEIISELDDAYSKEKINEKHYTLLKESISEHNIK